MSPVQNPLITLALAVTPMLPAQQGAPVYRCSPGQGSLENAGTEAAPWPALEAVIAAGALRDVRAGSTLQLGTGHHGAIRFVASDLTIEAVPGERPTLSRLELDRGARVTIRGLSISPSFGGEPYRGHIVRIGERGETREVTVEDCFICTTPDASGYDVDAWKSSNHGMLQGRHGEAITFRNNYVRNVRFGIELASPHSVCLGNVIRDFSGDGVRVMRDGIEVVDNVISNAWLDDSLDKNHDDAIQCFLFNKGSGTVRDVVVTGNLIIGREDSGNPLGSAAQGIGFFDGPLVDFRVEGNVLLVDHWHGVSLYDAKSCTIRDNACFSRWGGKRKPWVMLGKKRHDPEGNIVRDNLAHVFKLEADRKVAAAGNRRVGELTFGGRFRGLAKRLEEAYGETHATAELPRVPWRPHAPVRKPRR